MGVTPQEAAISAMVKVLTFVHALRLAGQLGCHLGLAATGAATGPGGGQAGHRPLLDEGRLVLGHQREDAENELAMRWWCRRSRWSATSPRRRGPPAW